MLEFMAIMTNFMIFKKLVVRIKNMYINSFKIWFFNQWVKTKSLVMVELKLVHRVPRSYVGVAMM